jgi:hypothetical protein
MSQVLGELTPRIEMENSECKWWDFEVLKVQ